MKIVSPTPLLLEAAEVLEPVSDVVVVVGAAAIEVALADASVAITPSRDVDVVVPVDRATDVVAYLEGAELRRSELAHERAFTWVRGDLKIQLVRTFHPFPKPPAAGLPENPVFGMAAARVHQQTVSFADNPTVPRLCCANAACLLALKQAAFGRTREPDGAAVERDYHDAYLLVSDASEALVGELEVAKHEVRRRAFDAITQLGSGERATIAAARQMIRLRTADTQREAEAEVRRAAGRLRRRLGSGALPDLAHE